MFEFSNKFPRPSRRHALRSTAYFTQNTHTRHSTHHTHTDLRSPRHAPHSTPACSQRAAHDPDYDCLPGSGTQSHRRYMPVILNRYLVLPAFPATCRHLVSRLNDSTLCTVHCVHTAHSLRHWAVDTLSFFSQYTLKYTSTARLGESGNMASATCFEEVSCSDLVVRRGRGEVHVACYQIWMDILNLTWCSLRRRVKRRLHVERAATPDFTDPIHSRLQALARTNRPARARVHTGISGATSGDEREA